MEAKYLALSIILQFIHRICNCCSRYKILSQEVCDDLDPWSNSPLDIRELAYALALNLVRTSY